MSGSEAAWREVPDPHHPAFVWRCCALVLEWRLSAGPWYPLVARNIVSTPEREALWLELFLHP